MFSESAAFYDLLYGFVDYAAAWDPIPDDGLPRYPERKPA